MPTIAKPEGTDVLSRVQDALRKKLGEERHAWWFAQGLGLSVDANQIRLEASSEFLAQRVRKRLLEIARVVSKELFGSEGKACVEVLKSEDGVVPLEKGSCEELSLGKVLRLRDSEPERSKRPTSSRGNGGSSGGASASGEARRRVRSANLEAQPLGVQPLGVQLGSRKNASGTTAEPSSSSGEVDSGLMGSDRSTIDQTSLSNFAIGRCNELAHVAAKMVTEQPGTPSPLFFWGPAGTGKTHLLAAIRNELRQRHRMRRVVMLSAEQFTNDFTGAVRGSGLPGFRRRYRDVEALLIDDVQFVGGKRATLRELLYTVDSLLRTRCQLAFTADRPPMELEGLNEELAGRLTGGMVCALRPLDRETRRKVLEGLSKRMEEPCLPDVLDRLADELAGDGRILSGAINHLRMLGQMLGRPATWDELLQSAPDLVVAGRPAVNLSDIQKAVCDLFGLPTGALRERGQQRAVSQPRMLAMYLARQYTRAAFSEIGDFFGNRSHSTVIAATKSVEQWIDEGKSLRRGTQLLHPRHAIEAIENLLRTG